jgi:beta-lactamase regulating signal transducer with metallopeptidase domain/HEAT repeat protein
MTMPTTISAGLTAVAGLPMLVLLAKATLILVLAVGVTVAMQRASAGSRHLVWLVTLAALLLVPALTAWAPLPFRVLPTQTANQSKGNVAQLANAPQVAAITLSDETASLSASNTTEAFPGQPSSIASRFDSMSALSMLMIVWALVVLAIAASLGYASLAVRRIVRHATPLDSQDWVGPMFEVADRLGLEEAPRLLRSEEAKMPFACGLLQPTIVLPAECDNWSLDRRRAVLLHELAHVRRHDLVGHTLGRLACAFYWFHPLVWTAAKQLRSESERACDDLALSCGARATDYAEHLLDIVTSVRRDSTPSVALAMARRKEFEGRMLAILDPELRHSTPGRVQAAGLIGSLALISIVVGAAAPAPRLSQEQQGQSIAERSAERIASKEKLRLPKSPKLRDMNAYRAQSDMGVDEASASAIHEQISEHTSEQVSTHVQTSMHENTSVNVAVGSLAKAAANAGVAIGASTASAILDAMTKGASKTGQKGSDDRPVLLANVLRTDASPELRRIAAWGLAEYAGNTVADNALAEALRRDSDASVREMAAWALADGKDDGGTVDALSAALRGDASVRVKAIAAWSLGNVGARSAMDALTGALSDPSADVRERAAWAIGNVEPKQAPRALINMLTDKEPHVRSLAAWALYQIEDPAAIPALDAALRAESIKELQIDYIRALAAIGEKSVDALRGLLESKDPEIKSVAVRALAGGNATGPWPWPWPEPRPSP